MDAEEIRKKINEELTPPSKSQPSSNEDLKSTKKTKDFSNPQIIFMWEAPLRAYKRKSAGVLRFYIALALLLSLIVFFFGDKILIMPIWATLFLVYVLTITPPPAVINKITRFGIETAGNTYRWEALSHFYFTKKFDYQQLVIVSIPPYNHHIYLVIKSNKDKEKVLSVLSEHIIYQEEPQMNFTDKMSDWLSKLMPDVEYAAAEPKPQRSVPSKPVEQSL